ncbi:hypothetical protein GOM49_04180 [Clostridium bovifaecis]|uniref:Uncharacterized protein n=1 Tax=Clostridium bovifaecis TaxID=2184719 RepID=A0A6I6F1Z7_9CLOT|nr:hypothetical protein GOM49_04180 [Clostridium bovifaecis]
MDYIDDSKAYNDFYDFLTESFDATHEDAEELMYELTAHIKNSDNIEEVISLRSLIQL